MALQPTRRSVLCGSSVLAATVLAGCSAIPGVGGSGDPDAGTDSYGVRLLNKTDHPYSVTITVAPRGSDELVFEETVESDPSEDHEWDQVVSGEGLYVVEASVDDDHFLPEAGKPRRTITVGTENAMEVHDILVEVVPTEVEGVTVGIRWDLPNS
ncbi:hypothetical protein [Halobacterium wangiae]|uniref:hypothetical protein n=1 Tax=Halobacterium wangiae TaxID=2902623 RepID=UPI001E2C4A9A|nr:hypothetical protein [Halobacterium wangiae]